MKKLFAIGLVICMVLSIIVVGVSLAEGPPVGAGAAKMSLWNSTGEENSGYTIEGGAMKIDDGPYGFVILNTDASGNLIVQFSLKGATPNKNFKLYVNQVLDGVIQGSNEVGELTTNNQGNGNAHFHLSRWVDADRFWVSAMELPTPYYPIHGLMLRSEAVVLD